MFEPVEVDFFAKETYRLDEMLFITPMRALQASDTDDDGLQQYQENDKGYE